VLVIVIV
jgi:hypothetical protein